jgi:hypothetical protein
MDRSIFWPEYVRAGWTRKVQVKQSGLPRTTVDVIYRRPTEILFGNTVSTNEHSIYFQTADLPNLAEGDAVAFLDDDGAAIKTERFTVRREPWVSNNPADDTSGYFSYAVLTKDE